MRRFRSVLASVVQVLISVVFPLPGATGTPVFFFQYSKGQLMGPILLKGILLKPICIQWLQRMCTGLWLIIENKIRVRSLDGAVGLQLNCFNRASIWRGDRRVDLKALWDEVLKLLQGYFLVWKFCFISKDKLFLFSFFFSCKPVLAVKLYLLFSLLDFFPLLSAPVGIVAPREAQHCSQDPLGRGSAGQQHRQCCTTSW